MHKIYGFSLTPFILSLINVPSIYINEIYTIGKFLVDYIRSIPPPLEFSLKSLIQGSIIDHDQCTLC